MKFIFVTIMIIISSHFSCLVGENFYAVQKRYANEVFVESGATAAGQATASAWEIGYKKIYLIDPNPVLINHAKYLFSTYFDLYPCYRPIPFSNWKPELGLIIGNPATELKNIIKDIRVPITFFLHSYQPNPDETKVKNTILLELKQIQEHPLKAHTIFIDNIDLAGTPLFGNITLDAILAELRAINKDYTFIFSNGGLLGRRPNALLIAIP